MQCTGVIEQPVSRFPLSLIIQRIQPKIQTHTHDFCSDHRASIIAFGSDCIPEWNKNKAAEYRVGG